VDVDAFAALLRERPRYAAVTMASNVTGIINPIAQLSELAHSNNVPLLLDACQAIAHVPFASKRSANRMRWSFPSQGLRARIAWSADHSARHGGAAQPQNSVVAWCAT